MKLIFPRVRYLLIALLIAGIFILDLSTPVGFVVSLLYLLPILLISKTARKKHIFGVTSVCTLLMFVGLEYSSPALSFYYGLINCLMQVLIFWFTAGLYLNHIKVQESLQESEALFRTLAEQSVVGIYLIQDGVFRYVNPRFTEIFGYTAEEITDKLGPKELTAPSDWPTEQEYIRQRMAGEAKFVHYTFRGMTKQQGVIYIEVYGSSTVYRGHPAIIGTLLDVTERKQAEVQLRQSEDRFRELADSLPQTVFETDLNGRLTYVNRAALMMFGYSLEDFAKGVTVMDVIVPQDRVRAKQNMEDRMRGARSGHQEYTALRKDGTIFPATVHSSPIVRDDRLVGLRGILIDLTDRKLFEAEQLQIEKLESIGVLAGGIAHDFNNILTGILGNLSLAKMRISPTDAVYQWIDQTEKASFLARDLTQQLLTFAKGGTPVKKVISLEPLIRNSSTFAAHGVNVKVDVQFTDELRPVEVDEGQIGQLISNLVINACQAMANGGILCVIASNCTIGSNYALSLPVGDYVCVEIRDQGIGIPAEHLPKIFDPYFTTKQQGSGLGLAVAYSVVKNHGGHIDVTSTLGTGTTFTVYLPASEKAVTAPSRAATFAKTGSGRVLVMDDEEIIRSVVRSILTELGYEAVFAKEGNEAVRLYREAMDRKNSFDAVIMDLTVPGGMGGQETIREIVAIDPEVKAIVSSGYSNDPIMSDYKSYGFTDVVKKPFRVEELSETLHRVLHGTK